MAFGNAPRARKDSIRRLQRCWLCRQREHPENSTLKFCDECLLRVLDLLCERTPPEGVSFFRTYNKSRWCRHADSETVLMPWDDQDYDVLADGRCEHCLREEYDKRHGV
jgi:hypothetical protein